MYPRLLTFPMAGSTYTDAGLLQPSKENSTILSFSPAAQPDQWVRPPSSPPLSVVSSTAWYFTTRANSGFFAQLLPWLFCFRGTTVTTNEDAMKRNMASR